MELSDLTTRERVALVALADTVVLADPTASAGEAGAIRDISDAIGEEAFRVALYAVRERVHDEASLERVLGAVERAEARELILAAVLELAAHDGIDTGEARILELASRVWDLRPEVIDNEDGSPADDPLASKDE